MHQLSPQQIVEFQAKILEWYAANKRDLPWRQSRDPYKILVSEIMLQQTQVSRVIPKYEAWLKTFPTVYDLAKAPVSEVLRLWSGLGYNRRALNLKKAAEIISSQYNRKFPQDEKQLLALPGIGQYTAPALLCFAFDQQVAVVDTNVKKVILTQFFSERTKRVEELSTSPSKNFISNKDIQIIADQLLPHGLAYDWNQALMDYASSVLKKEKISIPKQSKFIGSHRFYRGQVLKALLKKEKITLDELGSFIKKDYEEDWLRDLVFELKDEGFVVIEGNVVQLA